MFLCIESKNEDLNLLALQVLSRTYRMFDTNSIADNILPTLEKLRKAKNPTKQQAAILLEIYQNFAESLNSDVPYEDIKASCIETRSSANALYRRGKDRQSFD